MKEIILEHTKTHEMVRCAKLNRIQRLIYKHRLPEYDNSIFYYFTDECPEVGERWELDGDIWERVR